MKNNCLNQDLAVYVGPEDNNKHRVWHYNDYHGGRRAHLSTQLAKLRCVFLNYIILLIIGFLFLVFRSKMTTRDICILTLTKVIFESCVYQNNRQNFLDS
jgi:hypothetical protein